MTIELPYDPLLGIYPKMLKTLSDKKKYMYPYVLCGIIPNSQDMQITFDR